MIKNLATINNVKNLVNTIMKAVHKKSAKARKLKIMILIVKNKTANQSHTKNKIVNQNHIKSKTVNQNQRKA